MRLDSYNNLYTVLRETLHQLAPLLSRIKRIHAVIERRGIDSMTLLRSRISIPVDEQGKPVGTLGNDGKVRDALGNVVADYSAEKYECDQLISAINGLRAAIALLTDDRTFLQRPGATNVNHWQFVESVMDDEHVGYLE